MKRVVITGAGGFVGSRLVQHYRDIWDIGWRWRTSASQPF